MGGVEKVKRDKYYTKLTDKTDAYLSSTLHKTKSKGGWSATAEGQSYRVEKIRTKGRLNDAIDALTLFASKTEEMDVEEARDDFADVFTKDKLLKLAKAVVGNVASDKFDNNKVDREPYRLELAITLMDVTAGLAHNMMLLLEMSNISGIVMNDLLRARAWVEYIIACKNQNKEKRK